MQWLPYVGLAVFVLLLPVIAVRLLQVLYYLLVIALYLAALAALVGAVGLGVLLALAHPLWAALVLAIVGWASQARRKT